MYGKKRCPATPIVWGSIFLKGSGKRKKTFCYNFCMSRFVPVAVLEGKEKGAEDLEWEKKNYVKVFGSNKKSSVIILAWERKPHATVLDGTRNFL